MDLYSSKETPRRTHVDDCRIGRSWKVFGALQADQIFIVVSEFFIIFVIGYVFVCSTTDRDS